MKLGKMKKSTVHLIPTTETLCLVILHFALSLCLGVRILSSDYQRAVDGYLTGRAEEAHV
jgi:hypothetical protein